MQSQRVLPVVVYLEMALAAGNLAKKNATVHKITNLVWASPIIVSDQPVPVHLSLYPEGPQVEFVVSTVENHADRQIHAQGKLIYQCSVSEKTDTVDISAIQNRCVETWDGAKCYLLYQTTGINYGPRFQTIQTLYRNDFEALSRLVLPKSLTDHFNDFALHPSLMDGALQTVIGLVGNHSEGTLYAPFMLGEVELRKPLFALCYVYAQWVDHSSATDTSSKNFHLSILDDTGQVLVRLTDFSVRALTYPTKTLYYQSVWAPTVLEAQLAPLKPTGTVLLFDTDDSHYANFQARFASKVILVTPPSLESPKLCHQSLEPCGLSIGAGH